MTHTTYNGRRYKLAAYAPIRKKRGTTYWQRFWFLYDHDGEFRLNCQLLTILSGCLLFAVGLVTTLILLQ